MKIQAIDEPGNCYNYSLPSSITPKQIEKVLGFPPNVKDDPWKVKYSWGFEIDGTHCGIWDYCGARWSVYDPTGFKVRKLFEELA